MNLVLPRINGKLLLNQTYYHIIAYLAGIFNSTSFDFLIRRRISNHLNSFFVEQTPIPSRMDSPLGNEIARISARLNSVDDRFVDLAHALGVEYEPINMIERIELTAKLDALVAHQYLLNRADYEYIINTFTAFKEDPQLERDYIYRIEIDLTIRKFNGEMRKRVLHYYDNIKIQEGEMIEKRGH